jgi:glycogen synthase
MRILIATDSFPPICGGSGWSTYELARGLRARGHEIAIVQPRPGRRSGEGVAEYEGFRVHEVHVRVFDVPYVRNYLKNERLTRLLQPLLQRCLRERRIDIVHAQHVLTGLPAIRAARAERVPVVCTVRDYWPVCYWSDLIHDYAADHLCPACTPAMMTRCVRPRAGALWPAALPLVPYMRGNLRRKRRGLATADAVIAVSSTLARDLRARAPELQHTRLEIIPNPVNFADLRVQAEAGPRRMSSPYAIYVGKLAPNKGAARLLPVIERARLPWPLVIVGDGPDRARLEAAAARLAHDVRFTGWLPRPEALAWLRHASLLIFPSHGPESLSRVLLEASGLGVPIAAMDTGGTRNIISDEVTGLLSADPDALATDVRRLVEDATLRQRLGEAARSFAEERFAAETVVGRIEAVYLDLLGLSRATAAHSDDL